MRKSIFGFLVLVCCVAVTAAQDDICPALVQNALEYTDEVCSTTERNQACYGNLQINATPVEDVAAFKFDVPGDIENIAAIQSLQLSALSTPETWGVMLMQVQANLPDTLPGQNITMLLFGDVTLENQGGTTKTVILDATARNNARVRSGAGTQNGQIGSLRSGDVVQADGRNEAGDWLRVVLADDTAGWVSTDLLQVTGDVTTLSIVEGTQIAGTTYGPMQAFYFTSGIGEAACDEAPPDGLLIQTPEGAGTIDLFINEVQINVGSTIFITVHPDRPESGGKLQVYVLEGQVTLTSNNTTIVVPAGAIGIVPVTTAALPKPDDIARLAGYNAATIDTLTPLLALLPRAIDIAPGLTEAEIQAIPTLTPVPSPTARPAAPRPSATPAHGSGAPVAPGSGSGAPSSPGG
jgi:hypothetical protein